MCNTILKIINQHEEQLYPNQITTKKIRNVTTIELQRCHRMHPNHYVAITFSSTKHDTDFKPQKNRETLATDTALKIRNEFKRIIIEDYKKKRTSTEKLTARQRIRKEYSEKNREAAGGDIAAGEEVV